MYLVQGGFLMHVILTLANPLDFPWQTFISLSWCTPISPGLSQISKPFFPFPYHNLFLTLYSVY